MNCFKWATQKTDNKSLNEELIWLNPLIAKHDNKNVEKMCFFINILHL